MTVATSEDTRPLLGDARLSSNLVDDYAPVFPQWHSRKPAARFGDIRWEISGVDKAKSRTHWEIRFDDMSPEWALIARETLFIHINRIQFRHKVTVGSNGRLGYNGPKRAVSLHKHSVAFHRIERICTALKIGLPTTWLAHDTQAIRREVVAARVQGAGYLMRTMYQVRPLLTLGGIRFDPIGPMSVIKWEGRSAYRGAVAGDGIDAGLFYAIVRNALFYAEQAAPDIIGAIDWRNNMPIYPLTRRGPKANHERYAEAYPNHPDVVNDQTERMHQIVEELGGLPSVTVATRGKSARLGEPCMETLRAIVGLKRDGRHLPGFVRSRIAAGTPTVPGGLPANVTHYERPDGTVGPWRDPFCWNAVDAERQTLIDAAKIVVMAFTGMRDSELERIPRHGWLTTWCGEPAIWSTEVKVTGGDEMRWWVNDATISACRVLDSVIDPGARYLFQSVSHRRSREVDDVNSDNWRSIQRFVRRINTDQHLHGFLPIDAGWLNAVGKVKANDALPTITPRQFRITLAGVSNFVAFGDVAFQRQAKHARLTQTHSYAAKGANDSWAKQFLNAAVNADAQERATLAAELVMGVWVGEDQLAGHGGRSLTRTLRDLFESLNLPGYDDQSGEAPEDQFETLILTTPALAGVIRSTATLLHPGNLIHCLFDVTQAECADGGLEPVQALCHPETCGNVLLDPGQQAVIQAEHDQVKGWLKISRVGTAQRQVFERKLKNLEAQLRTEAAHGPR